jgi:hypothetical protein
VIQTVHIDIDVAAGTAPDNQDEQIVRHIAADLINAYRRDPEGWQRFYERCFPEVIARQLQPGEGYLAVCAECGSTEWFTDDRCCRCSAPFKAMYEITPSGRRVETTDLPATRCTMCGATAGIEMAGRACTRPSTTSDKRCPGVFVGSPL